MKFHERSSSPSRSMIKVVAKMRSNCRRAIRPRLASSDKRVQAQRELQDHMSVASIPETMPNSKPELQRSHAATSAIPLLSTK